MQIQFGNTRVFMAVLLAVLLGSVSTAQAAQNFTIQTGSFVRRAGPTILPVVPPVWMAGTAMATGTSPATVTIPASVIFHDQVQFKIPLATFPYVQFTTNFFVRGPTQAAVLAPGTRPSRPVNFAFCPGAAANPMCTTVAPGGMQGTKTGIVKYTAATPQFGGTMQMALGGSSVFSFQVGSSPVQIAHFGGGSVSPAAPMIEGGAYATHVTNLPGPTGAPITINGVQSVGGLITVPGTTVGTIPGAGSSATGFPFTVGKVYVKATGTGGTTTVSATGSDLRSGLGSGTITLVAGGLLQFALNTRVLLQTVSFTMGAPQVPSLGRTGLATVSALLVVGGAVFLHLRRRALVQH